MAEQQKKTDFKVIIGIVIAISCIIAVVSVLKLDSTGQQGNRLGQEFLYNIEKLGQIDPNLIIYKQLGNPISTGFAESHTIAIDQSGRIYVAGDKSIRIFNDGLQIGEIKLKESPLALAIESNNTATNSPDTNNMTIYIGLLDHIEVYKNGGELLKKWDSLGDKSHLTGIAVSGDNVFAADAGNRIVYRYDKAGVIQNQIGKKNADRNITGFVIPSPYFDLAVGQDGLLRVVNPGMHRIESYTFAGDLESTWGEFSNSIEGFCGCCNPVNFAILAGSNASGTDDKIITCEKGLTRVKVYSTKGKFIGVVAGPQQLIEGGKVEVCNSSAECQMGGFDVATGTDGRIFVLDTIKNIVRIFSPK
jgi:hypothetical protein